MWSMYDIQKTMKIWLITGITLSSYIEAQGFVRVGHRNTADPTFLNKKFLDRQNVYISQFL